MKNKVLWKGVAHNLSVLTACSYEINLVGP